MGDWNIKGRTAVYFSRVQNFHKELARGILGEGIRFSAEYASSAKAIPLAETAGLPRKAIAEGTVWGKTWESGYFRLRALVPAAWEGKELAAHLDFGGEALVYSAAGEPLYGMTSGSAFAEHYAKDVYRLGHASGRRENGRTGDASIELLVETTANGLFGVKPAPMPVSRDDPARHGAWEAKLNRARLCVFDEDRWGLYLDMAFLIDLLEQLDKQSVRAARLLKALYEATVAYGEGTGDPRAARARLAPEMNKPAEASALATIAVGHAHIDTAWLWPLAETRRKVARTFASQLDLIEKYPGYVFGASAPQHYQWTKEDHPGLYRRLKQAVADGAWELQGGMWVETDCNLVSGESLVRQILHGKNFFRDEFGVDVDTCWIPDVFGYAASMPQILRKSGIDYFLTQKMSWSKFNEFPHDTFIWRGLDGSEILTHFPPEQTYNSYGKPHSLKLAERNFHEKDRLDEFMTLLGIGDGGGGPKEEHLEFIRRARDCESLPKARFGAARGFFLDLEKRQAELASWTGELYLEYHRGTYTTQARTKKNNRRLENDLRATEALWTCLPLDRYPQADFDAITKTMLLLQFHDIIPGSSIHAVYEDAERRHAEALARLGRLRTEAAAALLAAENGAATFFNRTSAELPTVVELPAAFAGKTVADAAGNSLPTQVEEGGRVVCGVIVPAQGFLTVRASDAFRPPAHQAAQAAPITKAAPDADQAPLVLENALVRYRFDESGAILEAWDKRNAQPILTPGQKGNLLTLYGDTPHNYEAWDIDFYYPNQLVGMAVPVSRTRLASGPVRSGLRFTTAIGESSIVQDVFLAEGDTALSFKTRVDWKESRKLLRVTFPIAVFAEEAVSDIQYGFVKRPMRVNTEWEFAKFEFCAHRYLDVSNASGGVALLNDCKYGHSARDGVIGLTLLRSPLHPDPDADLGTHEFEYVLFPHERSLVDSAVMERAALLNEPPILFAGGRACRLPVRVEGSGVSVEALKKAEKEACLILRFVETRGLGTEVRIVADDADATACETNLVEWTEGERRPIGSGLTVTLKPFEIATYKIRCGRT